MDELTLVSSLPPLWYHSSNQFQDEKEHIFKKEWLFFCHSQEIPEKGNYITADVMGIPVIAMRDFEGTIQVLLNVCRHRAAPLLTEKKGCLERPVLMCQYHGWCYRLDGTFKHAPYLNDPSESLDLKKISFTEARGLIFVSFNSKPYAFDERKEKIIQEMDDGQFKMDEYSYHSQIVREGNFNWKIWVEGFQECYHCPTIHPVFNKDFQLSKYKVHNKDHYSVHECPRKAPSSSGRFEGLWLWLFPNMGLPCYEKVYYSLRVNPKSPTQTELIYTFFTHSSFTSDEEKEFFDFIKQITQEDFIICEQVQKNLQELSDSHLYDKGRLNLTRENGVHYFHQLIKKAIGHVDDRFELNNKLKQSELTP